MRAAALFCFPRMRARAARVRHNSLSQHLKLHGVSTEPPSQEEGILFTSKMPGCGDDGVSATQGVPIPLLSV